MECPYSFSSLKTLVRWLSTVLTPSDDKKRCLSNRPNRHLGFQKGYRTDRKSNSLDSLIKWSEPKRTSLEKASPEPVSRAKWANVPSDFELSMSPLNLCQESKQGSHLELLAQLQLGTPFPPSYRLTPCQGSFPFRHVFYALGLHFPPATFVDQDQIPTRQKMAPCIVTHLNQSLIFTVVKVIWFRIKWFYITVSSDLVCVGERAKGVWRMAGGAVTLVASEKYRAFLGKHCWLEVNFQQWKWSPDYYQVWPQNNNEKH